MKHRLSITGMVLSLLLSHPAYAADVELIVSRNTFVTSFYFRLPFDEVASVFGVSPLPHSTTDLTFSNAQPYIASGMMDVLDGLKVLSKDEVAETTPVAALVHDATLPPIRFDTPLDGSLSTAICTTPNERLSAPSNLTYTTAVQSEIGLTDGPIALTFPNAAVPVTLDLTYFVRGEMVQTKTLTLRPRESVRLTPTRRPSQESFLWIVAAVGVAAIAVFWRPLRLLHARSDTSSV